MEKKTRVTRFNELKELVEAHIDDAAEREDLLDFIDNQIAAIDRKKEAATRRAEKKKAESDALKEAIFDKIGEDTPITVDEIVVAFDDPDITRNKVTARLGKLFNEGRITKEQVKVDGKKKMAYKRVVADPVEETLE